MGDSPIPYPSSPLIKWHRTGLISHLLLPNLPCLVLLIYPLLFLPVHFLSFTHSSSLSLQQVKDLYEAKCFACVYCSIPHSRIESDTWKVLSKHLNQWPEGRDTLTCRYIITNGFLQSVMMTHTYTSEMLLDHLQWLKGSPIFVFEILMYGAFCFHACLFLRQSHPSPLKVNKHMLVITSQIVPYWLSCTQRTYRLGVGMIKGWPYRKISVCAKQPDASGCASHRLVSGWVCAHQIFAVCPVAHVTREQVHVTRCVDSLSTLLPCLSRKPNFSALFSFPPQFLLVALSSYSGTIARVLQITINHAAFGSYLL